MDGAGNIHATSNNSIVIIYKSGPASFAIIGSGLRGDMDGQFFLSVQNQTVPANELSFGATLGIALDSAGNMYVADARNNKIRKVTPDGLVSTFAGDGNTDEKDGLGTAASFAEPTYITIDGKGNLHVADQSSAKGEFLRIITPSGQVTTLCSQCLSELGGIVVDASGRNVYATGYITNVVDQISIF